jgi:tetratricopeptide (TPR) repeat protein
LEVEELMGKSENDTEQVRRSTLEALCAEPSEKTLIRTADLLLTAESADVCADCLDVLDRLEASAPMAEVSMNGWFEQIARRVNNFDEISAIMGERFLAYAFILNIQIRSLMMDPLSPVNTAVHFVSADSRMQTVSLGDFKLQVVQALLHDERLPPEAPSLPFRTDAAVALIGGRTLLIAPLFNIFIDRVILADPNPSAPRYLVTFILDGKFHVEALADFEERIRAAVRHDLSGMAEHPFTLDLFAARQAREAARRGDHLKVIELLEAWPGLLSVLHRTPTVKTLDDEQLALIAEGVCLLGEALEKEDRLSWSEELYKLGLQFVRETPEAARLMACLGRLFVDRKEFGRAIGLLRRALSLGLAEDEVLPLLGRSFLKQDKFVAARALLERCCARNYAGPYLDEDLAEARQAFDRIGALWDVPVGEIEVTS